MKFRFIASLFFLFSVNLFAQDTIYVVNNTIKYVHLTRIDSSYFYYRYDTNFVDEFRLKKSNIIKINFSKKNKTLFDKPNYLQISESISILDTIQLAKINNTQINTSKEISNYTTTDLLIDILTQSRCCHNCSRNSLLDVLFQILTR